MKKIAYRLLICWCICALFFLCSCSSKKIDYTLADGVFINLSVVLNDEVPEEEDFRINIEVNQNGSVLIYADEFKNWLSEEECPTENVELTPEQLGNIKRTIEEVDFYKMRENVGNRDSNVGLKKVITVYANNQEFVSGGVNISNRGFNKLYDSVYDPLIERIYEYKQKIVQMQQKASYYNMNKGIFIYDDNENLILTNSDFTSVERVPGKKARGLVTVDTFDDEFIVKMTVNEDGKSKLLEYLKEKEIYDGETELSFYFENQFKAKVLIHVKSIDTIYINKSYIEAEVNDLVKQMSLGLK